ncbi:hypothetical protein BC939DRAFT_505610 [Gamsiella multidivaricata]|uniref:uncharacterized protein n=1 Tax=Gamsiella multidivaricata TaxID=101098 RepID=UPI00221EC887|nr:uncharacterized protein BC939DRAFT_505610 [Gamsiella multidivaricata]KAG0370675.1 hypothetical protein BGZ54_004991 [Gamsiella multidivaricata]KAI7819606.1 hypothetical protein BC939DRAFT_505610 [Gamsiella multidivaricata]
MTEGSNIPHETHLTKHEGYGIEQPNEFFKRYGSHILTIMKLLKYGCTAACVAVPPLALFNLTGEIETVKKSLDVSVSTLGPLVDEAIAYIEKLGKDNAELDTILSKMDLNAIEALVGADRRQLESFLRIDDKGHDLGNLY